MSSNQNIYPVNPAKILREIEEWLKDPFNETLMFQEPMATLDRFASGGEVNLGEFLTSFTALATWYRSKGVIERFTTQKSAYLCRSFWFGFFYNRIKTASFERAKTEKKGLLATLFVLDHQKKPQPQLDFNDQGLLLAKAFALGLVAEGEAIGHYSLVALKEGCFYGTTQTSLTPFVLKCFATWKGLALPSEFTFVLPDAYEKVVQKLTAGPEEISAALMAACDYHVSRSHDHTDDETYEFADSAYWVYPVELLFVFRIREILGLTNPEVAHPLLNSPLGRLTSSPCSLDPSLYALRDRIEQDFPVGAVT